MGTFSEQNGVFPKMLACSHKTTPSQLDEDDACLVAFSPGGAPVHLNIS
jgi:hypothetical protein